MAYFASNSLEANVVAQVPIFPLEWLGVARIQGWLIVVVGGSWKNPGSGIDMVFLRVRLIRAFSFVFFFSSSYFDSVLVALFLAIAVPLFIPLTRSMVPLT